MGDGKLGLLYERSDEWNIIFVPDQILFLKVQV